MCRQRREELGLAARETFVPRVYEWGAEAQVDWYEAVADVGDERRTVYPFAVRSKASGGAFDGVYYHATPRVAAIVRECSDSESPAPAAKLPWHQRKQAEQALNHR